MQCGNTLALLQYSQMIEISVSAIVNSMHTLCRVIRHCSKFMMSTLVGNDHKAVAGGIVVKEAHRVDLDTIAPLFDAYR